MGTRIGHSIYLCLALKNSEGKGDNVFLTAATAILCCCVCHCNSLPVRTFSLQDNMVLCLAIRETGRSRVTEQIRRCMHIILQETFSLNSYMWDSYIYISTKATGKCTQ